MNPFPKRPVPVAEIKSDHRVQHHKLAYIPGDGKAFNPMRSWPRNEPCWCSSGIKAKKCCLPRALDCIPIKEAESLAKCMAMPRGLAVIRAVFLDKAKAAGDVPADPEPQPALPPQKSYKEDNRS